MHELCVCCVCFLCCRHRRRRRRCPCRYLTEYFWFLNADMVAETKNIAINCETQRWPRLTHTQYGWTCRPCAQWAWAMFDVCVCCCFGFFTIFVSFVPISREHIRSGCGDGGGWKMWNMSSERRQRCRSWRWRNQIYEMECTPRSHNKHT